MQTKLAEWLRDLQSVDLDGLNETELALLQEQLHRLHGQVGELLGDVAAVRAARWWAQMPPEEVRELRVLLKGSRLTPHVLQGASEFTHLLLLTDIEDPQVVRMWAQMSPEVRAKRLDEVRRAMRLTDVRKRTTVWEDERESVALAYDVLGLTPACSHADLRTAYRTLAARHHPDKGGDPQMFTALQKAYKLLEARFL